MINKFKNLILNKKGFSLIELSIAIFVVSISSISLFNLSGSLLKMVYNSHTIVLSSFVIDDFLFSFEKNGEIDKISNFNKIVDNPKGILKYSLNKIENNNHLYLQEIILELDSLGKNIKKNIYKIVFLIK